MRLLIQLEYWKWTAEVVLLLHLQGSLGYSESSWEVSTSLKCTVTPFMLTYFQGSPMPLFEQFLVWENGTYLLFYNNGYKLLCTKFGTASPKSSQGTSRHWTLTVSPRHTYCWGDICFFQTEMGFSVFRITFGTRSSWQWRHHSHPRWWPKAWCYTATAFSK